MAASTKAETQGSVRLTSLFLGDFTKGDPDEAEPDPDPAPAPNPDPDPVPAPGKARAHQTTDDGFRRAARDLCRASGSSASSSHELCAPVLAAGERVEARFAEGAVHSYQLVVDRWTAMEVEMVADRGGMVDLLSPTGHRLARYELGSSDARGFETLAPGTYTLRVMGTGAYSLVWSAALNR